jgi:hypothetical protein
MVFWSCWEGRCCVIIVFHDTIGMNHVLCLPQIYIWWIAEYSCYSENLTAINLLVNRLPSLAVLNQLVSVLSATFLVHHKPWSWERFIFTSFPNWWKLHMDPHSDVGGCCATWGFLTVIRSLLYVIGAEFWIHWPSHCLFALQHGLGCMWGFSENCGLTLSLFTDI